MRLCSAERFEVAIAKANYNLSVTADELKRWPHVKLDEIALLLEPGCQSVKPGRVMTEFWDVPRAAPMPPHVRNISLTSASVDFVRAERPGAQVKEFVRRLRESPDSYGVVLGRYFSRPAPLLRRRVLDAERLVRRNKDLRGRFTAALVPYGFTFTGQVEPTEPSFLIIRIPKADASDGRPSPAASSQRLCCEK